MVSVIWAADSSSAVFFATKNRPLMRSACAPQVGLEPTTTRLTAGCSAIELLRNKRGNRQRPILPGRVQPSTFGTEELNCCVRYGNRWNLFVITTGSNIVAPSGAHVKQYFPKKTDLFIQLLQRNKRLLKRLHDFDQRFLSDSLNQEEILRQTEAIQICPCFNDPLRNDLPNAREPVQCSCIGGIHE